jgi:IS30 family transposase
MKTNGAHLTGKERVTIKRLSEKGLPRYQISAKTGRSAVTVAKVLGPDTGIYMIVAREMQRGGHVCACFANPASIICSASLKS